MQNIYDNIVKMVKRIPYGKVASYGQIAAMAGARNPRMVGYALSLLKDESIPWWRIVNSQLKISLRKGSQHHILQRKLLEREGVKFNNSGKIDTKFRFRV